MGMIIRTSFNNQSWANTCKKQSGMSNVTQDQRLFKCFDETVATRPTLDKDGNCSGGKCWEKSLCAEFYWWGRGYFRQANIGDKVFFVYPDTDNSLVLWGISEVEQINQDDEFKICFKPFNPLPHETWVKGIAAKDILGVHWGQGTYRYLNNEQIENIEDLIRKAGNGEIGS